jgi:hypothetical protein
VRRRITFRAVAATVALLAATASAACGPSGPKHVIEYDVIESNLSGSGPDDVPSSQIQYGYTLHDQQGKTGGGELFDATLPLHKRLTAQGSTFWEIFLLVQDLEVPAGTDPDHVPTVQCQITVDGKVVITKAAQGPTFCDLDQASLQTLGL